MVYNMTRVYINTVRPVVIVALFMCVCVNRKTYLYYMYVYIYIYEYILRPFIGLRPFPPHGRYSKLNTRRLRAHITRHDLRY